MSTGGSGNESGSPAGDPPWLSGSAFCGLVCCESDSCGSSGGTSSGTLILGPLGVGAGVDEAVAGSSSAAGEAARDGTAAVTEGTKAVAGPSARGGSPTPST